MKKKILIIIAHVALLGAISSSCTKKIDEAYANPNADVRVPVEKLLPPLISCMSGNSAGHGQQNDIRFIGKYIQNFLFSGSGGTFDQMGILVGSDNTGSIWRIHFYDIGLNCINMIKWAQEEKKWDYAGVGQAILAWSWLILSDYHGEVIATNEAFNQSALTFSYGTQEEVYDHVRKLCYESLANLNNTGDASSPTNLALGDAYFYNGDVNKWKKFVYGVLARTYQHLTNKSIYKPDSVVYFCNLSLASNADNGNVKYAGGVSGNSNYFGPFRGNLASALIGTESSFRQSKFIADLESGLNNTFLGVTDPRAIYLLRLNSNTPANFKGLVLNKGTTPIPANDRPESFYGISQTGGVDNTIPGSDANCRYVFKNTSEWPVITASEIQFMKAEALYRMNDKPGALAAYRAGIDLNFDMLMNTFSTSVPAGMLLTTAIKNNFLANPAVVPPAANLTLSQIMLQKYIALYIHGACETWVDMRRYHYTDLDPVTGQQVYRDFLPPQSGAGGDLFSNNGGKLVYRLRPRFNSEYVWNLNELNRIGASAADYHTKECWFSKP